MDDLIEQVVQKTGLPADRARAAVETVLAFLKGKLPEPLAGQLDQAVAGNTSAGLGDLAKSLGGLFGNQP